MATGIKVFAMSSGSRAEQRVWKEKEEEGGAERRMRTDPNAFRVEHGNQSWQLFITSEKDISYFTSPIAK